MITFNTQEEFEEAVMEIVRKRLGINLYGYIPDHGVVYLEILDRKENITFVKVKTE